MEDSILASASASCLRNQVPFGRAAIWMFIGTAVSFKERLARTKKNAVYPGLIIAPSFLTGTQSAWKSVLLCISDVKEVGAGRQLAGDKWAVSRLVFPLFPVLDVGFCLLS